MADTRPNLIFILADDIGYADLGCTGARDVHSNATDVSPRLDAMAAQGKALMVVSSDLRELMELCDRISVMHDGRIVATFERGHWTAQALLEAAFGEAQQTPVSLPAAEGEKV